MQDQFGRTLDYLRLSLTDRCNLRCNYCMPEEGIELLPREDILRLDEFYQLAKVFVQQGVKKIRLTGGEPLLRKDLMSFVRKLKDLPGLEEVHITTNGILLSPFVKDLQELGLDGVNLSLDTLDAGRFQIMTRGRDEDHGLVLRSIGRILTYKMPLKINSVIQDLNADEIVKLASLSLDNDLELRFIEQMPFNGSFQAGDLIWDQESILYTLKNHFKDLEFKGFNSTAYIYQVPGAKGSIGIIAGNSRTFCDSCSRLRLSSQGMMKTCLYGADVLDLRTMLRSGVSEFEMGEAIKAAAYLKAEDGYAAEKLVNPSLQSMASIGG